MRSFLLRTTGLGVLLLACTLAFGCDIGDFGDINDDPTAPNEIDSDLLFTRAIQYGTLRYNVYQRGQHLFGNQYVQYFANLAPDFPTDRYESAPPYDAWAAAYWKAIYASQGGIANIGENVSNSGINTQIVINRTQDDPQKINITSQARIWKVFLMHRMTDAWGDVPYEEAFQGLEGNRTPAYDPQEEIYRSMLTTLETAADALDPSITGERFRLGESDLLFGDDLERWRHFANSLRLRLAMRISEVDPALAEQHVQDILQNRAIISSNAGSARRPTTKGGELITQNPLSVIDLFDDDRVSELVVDTLKALDDPRLPVYADTILTAFQDTVTFRGLPNGLGAGTLSGLDENRYSKTGDPVRRQDVPVPVLLYPEVKFLEAEAALRNWGPGPAQDHYEEGIRASLAMYDITDPQTVQDYLQQPEVAWDRNESGAEKLEKIITQKWIALFSQGFEMWAEFRRTGYPRLRQIPNDGDTNGEVPSRILYVSVEKNTNTENVEAAAQRIGGDAMTTDVWWDEEQSILVSSDGSE